jgi:hypothetical protein
MPGKSTKVQEAGGKGRGTASTRSGGFESCDPPKSDDEWTTPKGGLPTVFRPGGMKKKV